MDVDGIQPGEDFVQRIEETVASCKAMLVIVGKSWATASDDTGSRRLDDPQDFVRLEIATALQRRIRVIPVLVSGAKMPRPQDLPEDLSALTRRQAVEISDFSFVQTLATLIAALDGILREPEATEATASGASATPGAASGNPRQPTLSSPASAAVFQPLGLLSVSRGSINLVRELKIAKRYLPVTRQSSVLLISNGSRALTTCNEDNIVFWDLTSGSEAFCFRGHIDAVTCLAVGSRGQLAVSGSDDRTLRLWDLSTCQEKRIFRGHNGSIGSVVVTADDNWAISAAYDGTIKVWDLSSGRELATLLTNHYSWACPVLAHHSNHFVAGFANGHIDLWDMGTGEKRKSFPAHQNAIVSLVFTKDGFRMVSASSDHNVKVWNLRGNEEALMLIGHTDAVTCVAIARDENRVLTGSADRTIRIWDLRSGTQELLLRGHTAAITSIALTFDGRLVISGSRDGTVRLWDGLSGQEIDCYRSRGRIDSCALGSDDVTVVATSGRSASVLRLGSN